MGPAQGFKDDSGVEVRRIPTHSSESQVAVRLNSCKIPGTLATSLYVNMIILRYLLIHLLSPMHLSSRAIGPRSSASPLRHVLCGFPDSGLAPVHQRAALFENLGAGTVGRATVQSSALSCLFAFQPGRPASLNVRNRCLTVYMHTYRVMFDGCIRTWSYLIVIFHSNL